ncbi:tetratricopeptide repeat protein [Marinomonas spartinae]|uniref:tetratricopeptide repeat protein n=1 Tax=Marinomonas spartinae TaxID=1792290 RepID=UPI0018F2633D|nr:tetratricopeptide repeat protein [Marinomonas spartinae]MBJ7555520.1 tetratricopeptide repeat protein [Marinomonas spartinae]
MESVLEEAIALRQSGQYDDSRRRLNTLLYDEDWKAKAHLQIAWSYDNEGREHEAIVHYESALSGLLSKQERFDALFGLASTLRGIGSYKEALHYFELTLAEYPNEVEVKPFYAMCLYNLGRHKEATALLLELLISTTNHESIKTYQQAIMLYAKDLDKVW